VTDGLARLSLNQITIDQWSLDEAVEACAAAGVPWISVWRHKLGGRGAAAAGELVRAAGMQVSSLCRGGFFTAGTTEADDDNRRAVEEAAALGTDVLVLVCGPPPSGDLRRGRRMVAEGVERLLPHAVELGVRLGIEPLHPMMVADRSAIVSLAEARALAESFDSEHVGVVVVAYHVFWDPAVEEELARLGSRIVSFHVSDWVTPTGDVLASRALPGDGIIDLRGLRAAADAAGYAGPIEVEIISETLRARPPDEVLRLVVERYLAAVA
jgi:sugar phosphate isomerase/epimerase